MPFTASHPAAVIPFARTALPTSALVIGSMVPDLPLYVPAPYSARLSHQFLGAVTVDVLAGIVLYTGWLTLLRPLIVAYAPTAMSRRIPRPERPKLTLLVGALALGAVTHVVWDGFTHGDGWGVRLAPFLDGRVGPLPAYEWAQYTSGLLGMVAVLMWTMRIRRTAADVADRDSASAEDLVPRRSAAVAAVVAGVAAGAAFGVWYGLGHPDPIRSAFFYAATRGIDVGIAIALVIGVIRRFVVGAGRGPRQVGPHVAVQGSYEAHDSRGTATGSRSG